MNNNFTKQFSIQVDSVNYIVSLLEDNAVVEVFSILNVMELSSRLYTIYKVNGRWLERETETITEKAIKFGKHIELVHSVRDSVSIN